ncbi:MAG TPA: SprB repeat-containing protein, partial [Gillisia sp.]|nr:SprB repeat-containing protein [Gillisia sp.]
MKNFTITGKEFFGHFKEMHLKILKWNAFRTFIFTLLIFTGPLIFGQIVEKNQFIDGNAVQNGMYLDWENLYNGQVPDNSVFSGIIFDDLFDPLRTVDKTFTQGSKDHNDIPAWTNTNSGPNDKTDIQQAAAFLYDGVIYFMGNLYAANGDANIGFWFLQYANPDTGDGVMVNGTGFTGQHVVGDLFVVAAFSGGGKIDNIAVYEWVGSGGDLPKPSLSLKILIPPNVEGTPYSPYITAVVNTESITAPWAYHTKGVNGPTLMPALTFFEGYIDLKGLLNDPNIDFELAGGNSPCFSSFFVNTRNSTSVDASLNDFANGGFDVRPRVTLTADPICEGDTQSRLEPTVNGGLKSNGDFLYQWSKDGIEIPANEGGTASFYQVNEDAGSYVFKVEVTGLAIDGVGTCIGEDEVTVIISPSPELDLDGTNLTCNGSSDGAIDLTVSSDFPPFKYEWETEDGVIPEGQE